MPSIHIIYDPRDIVRIPTGDELHRMKVSHVSLAVSDDMSKAEAAKLAKGLGEALLSQITK